MSDFLTSGALFALFQVIMIDIVLAGDNALVIGMSASHVARQDRNKVIFWGLTIAVVLRIVLAIELLTAARAIDLRAPLEPAAGTGAVRRLLRHHVEGCGPDRQVSPEIEAAVGLVADGAVLAAAESAVGALE